MVLKFTRAPETKIKREWERDYLNPIGSCDSMVVNSSFPELTSSHELMMKSGTPAKFACGKIQNREDVHSLAPVNTAW